jgi:hypothetical protein
MLALCCAQLFMGGCWGFIALNTLQDVFEPRPAWTYAHSSCVARAQAPEERVISDRWC